MKQIQLTKEEIFNSLQKYRVSNLGVSTDDFMAMEYENLYVTGVTPDEKIIIDCFVLYTLDGFIKIPYYNAGVLLDEMDSLDLDTLKIIKIMSEKEDVLQNEVEKLVFILEEQKMKSLFA